MLDGLWNLNTHLQSVIHFSLILFQQKSDSFFLNSIPTRCIIHEAIGRGGNYLQESIFQFLEVLLLSLLLREWAFAYIMNKQYDYKVWASLEKNTQKKQLTNYAFKYWWNNKMSIYTF